MLLVSLRRKPGAATREAALQGAEDARAALERSLSRGGCLLYTSLGGHASLYGDPVRLRAMLAILRSSEANEVKTQKLRQGPLDGLSPETIARLVTGFAASDQLERRLGAFAAAGEEATAAKK